MNKIALGALTPAAHTNMRTFCCLIALAAICSCKKTVTEPNSPPPGPDTSQTHSPDTSYLVKTIRTYNYDATGTQITDSSFFVWTYDSKHRMSSRIGTNFDKNTRDTINYSYGSTQRTVHYMTYYDGGTSVTDEMRTYYLNSSGNPDSILNDDRFTFPFNGNQVTQTSKSGVFLHYDALGHDTLWVGYNIGQYGRTPYSITRKSYDGDALDSMVEYNDPAHLDIVSYIAKFKNGNYASDEINPHGTPHSIRTYTYNGIPSGGFYFYEGTTQLLQSLSQEFLNPVAPTSVANYTYTFDAANRVKTFITSKNNIVIQKSEYTYL